MSDPSTTGPLRALLDAVPPSVRRRTVTHASWASRRAESYERLAFVGDGVLGLAVATHLYRTLEEDRFGAGRLTVARAGTVGHGQCRAVAEELGLPALAHELAPGRAQGQVAHVVRTERALAEMCEAVIGAGYLEFGYERVAPAVVQAFGPHLGEAIDRPGDHKSRLQEHLFARGKTVVYRVVDELGEPHDRTFVVEATVDGDTLGSGRGRSKKLAEQEAAREALATLGA
ncbi:MAG: putative dsRNA-binding protein [Solirubrobacteraceae bacterium]|nr:putative dsRNA-binding protein [Solirubrobacteraceae bacterium]